jgi:hypothetical protein
MIFGVGSGMPKGAGSGFLVVGGRVGWCLAGRCGQGAETGERGQEWAGPGPVRG